jgi:hypothetical protein
VKAGLLPRDGILRATPSGAKDVPQQRWKTGDFPIGILRGRQGHRSILLPETAQR